MKKWFFVFLICCLAYSCSKSGALSIKKKLPASSQKKFERIHIKKFFSVDLTMGGACIPFSQGILIIESLDDGGNRYILKYVDPKGELKKERLIKRSEGPDSINVISELFTQGDKIFLFDNNTYLKMINPYDLNINTVQRLSNKIKGYFTKFVFGLNTQTDIECFDNQTITSFEGNNPDNLNYYIVYYKGDFNQFRIINEVKRELLESWENQRKSAGKECFLDYDNLTKSQRNLAVDWKNSMVYFLADYEKPGISMIDFKGRLLTNIFLGIESIDFPVDKSKIDVWNRWALAGIPPMFKKKYKCMTHEKNPVLRDIDILGDCLLVTTGKRNWDTFENEVLAYRLPALNYLGAFFIPTGDWPSKKFGRFLVTKRIIEKDDNFTFQFNCYEMEIR
jgi:hypothetical protein